MQEAGYPLTDDVNGYRQEGFAPFDRTIYRGRRSAPRGRICTRSWTAPTSKCAAVRSSRESSSRASGPSAWRSRGCAAALSSLFAGEVILCGGAINSPQLLQLSGVGNAAELSALGVDVVEDLPAVGENLQDHLEVYVQYACTQPVSMAPTLEMKNRPLIGAQMAVPAQGPRRDEPLRGRRLRAQQRARSPTRT